MATAGFTFVFVVAVVTGGFFVDVVHHDAGDWRVDFLERIASGVEDVLGSVRIFSDDEHLIDKRGEHDGVGDAVARSAVKDDDIEEDDLKDLVIVDEGYEDEDEDEDPDGEE